MKDFTVGLRDLVTKLIAELITRAEHEVLETGPFEPVTVMASLPQPQYPIDEVTLSVGMPTGRPTPSQDPAAYAKLRYFEVGYKTLKNSGVSSSWLYCEPKDQLLQRLKGAPAIVDKIMESLQSQAVGHVMTEGLPEWRGKDPE
jgi:hypothetical protein